MKETRYNVIPAAEGYQIFLENYNLGVCYAISEPLESYAHARKKLMELIRQAKESKYISAVGG